MGCNAFETCKGKLDKVVTLDEDFISLAVVKLLESEKAVVEGAGASAFAAILSGVFPELKGKKWVNFLFKLLFVTLLFLTKIIAKFNTNLNV